MPDDTNSTQKSSGGAADKAAPAAASATHAQAGEHYEEIAEYRIGEGPPPLSLVVMFVLIVLWATLSWIPFFGY